MKDSFVNALSVSQAAFGLELTAAQMELMDRYYNLVQEHNGLLHLVAPCSPEEFGVRHILESLTLLPHLPDGATFVDVGTGAGLPSIPCLLVRDDLRGILIESKEKKTNFLIDAVDTLGLDGRAKIINKQYSESDTGGAQFVTSRALDKFTEKLPHLIRWARGRKLLLFGGPSLEARLQDLRLKFVRQLMPMSEQRYLFVIER